jgi:predicted alpha/beta superfamily hydrolase
MITRLLSWFALVPLVLPPVARAQAPTAGAITIGRVDSIWSPTLKERRRIWVYTPPSYRDTVRAPHRYPVLYLLDGDAHFHSVTGLLQILGTGVNGTYVVPEMIVVAIPNTDRTRDLTPTRAETSPDGRPNPGFRTSGGAPNFLKFMKSELIPYVDSAYRTAPYRVLVGHSFGGIAAIHALYTMPETFNAYVAIDPSLWWDNRQLLRQATDYFKNAKLAGRALFVGQANTLSPADTTDNAHYSSIVRFNRLLERYRSDGLRYAYRYYPNDSHGSVPLIAEYEALRFIFADYSLDAQRAMDEPDYIGRHFAHLTSVLGYDVRPPERALDQLGRSVLQRDTTKAIAILELNARFYPNSAKAQDALGDAWLAKGDRAKAAAYFEKSLALKPGNEYATTALRRLR